MEDFTAKGLRRANNRYKIPGDLEELVITANKYGKIQVKYFTEGPLNCREELDQKGIEVYGPHYDGDNYYYLLFWGLESETDLPAEEIEYYP